MPVAMPQLPSDAPIINPIQAGTGIPVIRDWPGSPVIRIAVPGDIFSVLNGDPGIAWDWRDTTRRSLAHYMGAGYRVVTFQRDSGEAYGTYYLQRTDTDSPTPP